MHFGCNSVVLVYMVYRLDFVCGSFALFLGMTKEDEDEKTLICESMAALKVLRSFIFEPFRNYCLSRNKSN